MSEANVPALQFAEADYPGPMSRLNERGSAGVHPEACITREHNSLVTVSYADLVEYVRDVVADGFFRKPERGGNR